MAGINTLIAQGGPSLNLSGAGDKFIEAKLRGREIERQETQDARAEEDRQLNRQAAELQIKSANIDLLDERQKRRFEDISGFSSAISNDIDAAIETGDTTTLEQKFTRRLNDLTQRREREIAAGIPAEEATDITETLEALNLVKSGNLEELSGIVSEVNEISDFRNAKTKTGGNVPAAIQLADEIGKARAAKDTQRLRDLQQSGKLLTKGQIETAQGGIELQEGVAGAEEELAEAKETGKQKAKLKLAPEVASAVKVAEIVAVEKGEALAALDRQVAQFPRLEEVTGKLEILAETATFTAAGKARDTALRQANLPLGEGAVARAEYIATIDNEVLPLLRDTFGAQFTEREGQTLKKTLGDPDSSPEEKIAVLKAFINQKAGKIETLQRQLDEEPDEIDAEIEALEKELGLDSGR